MAMIIDNEKTLLRFDVPNSEASIEAQHNGIKERTVGSYYMSDQYELCRTFLSDFNGEYYLDLALSIRNAKIILNILNNKNYANAFKSRLVPQEKQIEALEWVMNNGDYLYKIKPPFVNEQKKYLKLDNLDTAIQSFKALVLGDLCSVFFKKIGDNGFIIYVDKNPNFDKILETNTILNWMN